MESINIWKAELWGKDLTGVGREMMCISNIDLWWPLKIMCSVFRELSGINGEQLKKVTIPGVGAKGLKSMTVII